jgi:ribonuclease HI
MRQEINQMTDEKPQVIIYTDGGCRPNPGRGGWGVLLMSGVHEREMSGAERDTTNNRMELTAAIKALEVLDRPCEVTLFTDSEYVKNGISKWINNWLKNGWKSGKKPVKNQDLWKRLHEARQRHDVNWRWTKGHAGNKYNERVDQLATDALENL